MDLLTRFRVEVPLGVSPHAKELFDAGIHDHYTERPVASGRKQVTAGNVFLTERGLDSAVVKDIAAELGTTPSRVALARTMLNPAVTAPINGSARCGLGQRIGCVR